MKKERRGRRKSGVATGTIVLQNASMIAVSGAIGQSAQRPVEEERLLGAALKDQDTGKSKSTNVTSILAI